MSVLCRKLDPVSKTQRLHVKCLSVYRFLYMNHRRNTVDKQLCSLYEDVEASWRLTSNLSRAWLLEKHFLLSDRRSHSDSFICLEKVFYFFPALPAFDFNTVNDLHKAWLTIAHLNGTVWHLWILLERFTTVFSMETCLLNPRTSRPSVRLLSLKITLKQMCHQDHSEVYECECETWRRQVSLAGDANPPRRVNANVPSLLHKISAHSTGLHCDLLPTQLSGRGMSPHWRCVTSSLTNCQAWVA